MQFIYHFLLYKHLTHSLNTTHCSLRISKTS